MLLAVGVNAGEREETKRQEKGMTEESGRDEGEQVAKMKEQETRTTRSSVTWEGYERGNMARGMILYKEKQEREKEIEAKNQSLGQQI